MDSETQRIYPSNNPSIKYMQKKEKKNSKIIIFLTIVSFLIFIIIGIYLFFCKINTKKKNFIYNKEEVNTNQNKEGLFYDEFDQNILELYKKNQIFFCKNKKLMRNDEYEENIQLISVRFLSENFNLYAYKKNDIVSSQIYKSQTWETVETQNMLSALQFYSSRKEKSKKEIYVLDIGSNIGWHSFILGKFGYNIISFETSKMNNYILNKNFCLNNNLNIILIKKGLYSEEKICSSYVSRDNIGDEIIFCESNETIPQNYKKNGKTYLTVLDKYISFLSKNNLALIKIDIEGNEGKAFEGGIKLLTKYNVPFIFLEFNKESLIHHGTDPKQLLELFQNHGYKFKKYNFFENHLMTIDEILNYKDEYFNLYITHSNILK